MTYSSEQIEKAVSTVHMNSRRQAKRNLTTNFANGDINFIGDCCFAYSGVYTADATGQEVMRFNSGPNYIHATFRSTGFVDKGSPATGSINVTEIKFNGVGIFISHTEGYNPTAGISDSSPAELIIPPFTEVDVRSDANATSTGVDGTTTMIGKVYSGAEIIQGAI